MKENIIELFNINKNDFDINMRQNIIYSLELITNNNQVSLEESERYVKKCLADNLFRKKIF